MKANEFITSTALALAAWLILAVVLQLRPLEALLSAMLAPFIVAILMRLAGRL